ncbi:branched-chain amino acid transport system permease protein [Ochrobactrum intermedium]|uniref:Branched-chain amino acid transport system permease protein n=1 Tax=Brucella intermedia TaxID=94625 RepID=A0ABR6AVR7_9HYPH|nr:branched-chain amino acid ABC transporter permease [Brucella intermedia]MBA8853473.1 branched-chain amino acid transport system permease protein [Brucella intermedia]
MSEFLQFLITGITLAATYGLIALGFSIIYNATHIINFAQGDFAMIGGMSAVFALSAGLPLPLAILVAVAAGALCGVVLYQFGIRLTRKAGSLPLIIVTLGAALAFRGFAQVLWGKDYHSIPGFSGNDPIRIFNIVIMPQSLWVIGSTVILVVLLSLFFNRTRLGKAVLATSYNPDAARLMGINTNNILFLSFGLAGFLGAIAGVIVTPITLTYYEIGVLFGLKGFVAAVLGGLGSFPGAIAGAIVLGITEVMVAGYLSSDYKDAVAFVMILFILIFMPNGLFGKSLVERV